MKFKKENEEEQQNKNPICIPLSHLTFSLIYSNNNADYWFIFHWFAVVVSFAFFVLFFSCLFSLSSGFSSLLLKILSLSFLSFSSCELYDLYFRSCVTFFSICWFLRSHYPARRCQGLAVGLWWRHICLFSWSQLWLSSRELCSDFLQSDYVDEYSIRTRLWCSIRINNLFSFFLFLSFFDDNFSYIPLRNNFGDDVQT